MSKTTAIKICEELGIWGPDAAKNEEKVKAITAILGDEPVPSFPFTIGTRTYHLARDARRGNGWAIISSGDLVHYVSANHYGDVGSLKIAAEILNDIELRWIEVQCETR